MKILFFIVTFTLLQSCTSDVKPLIITEVQDRSNNPFAGVKVVYKSMLRAAQNKFGSDSIGLEIINQIDRIYYYQKDSTSFGYQPNLGGKIDSIIATDHYTEISKVRHKGKNYSAFVKHKKDRVSEILLFQNSAAEILLIDIQGNISLRDVMQNITNLPDLLQLSDLNIL